MVLRSAVSDIALFEEIIRLGQQGCPSVLVTVIESIGSSPRKVGAKMLVRSDRSIMGSIGGGGVELEVIAAALTALQNGKPQMMKFNLASDHGYVCGGSMRVYLEPNKIESRLVIMGAGHVGSALTALGRFAGFNVTVIDDRQEYACPELLPEANTIIVAQSPEALSQIDVHPATAIVIATPGFEQDFDAVCSALKTAAGYIGLIGSQRKKKVLVEALTREGFSVDDIARIKIPVGLAINAETPEEIAVSIVAQLIGFRNGNAWK